MAYLCMLTPDRALRNRVASSVTGSIDHLIDQEPRDMHGQLVIDITRLRQADRALVSDQNEAVFLFVGFIS